MVIITSSGQKLITNMTSVRNNQQVVKIKHNLLEKYYRTASEPFSFCSDSLWL